MKLPILHAATSAKWGRRLEDEKRKGAREQPRPGLSCGLLLFRSNMHITDTWRSVTPPQGEWGMRLGSSAVTILP